MGLVHVCWADALHSRVLEDLAQHRGPIECRAIFEPVKLLFIYSHRSPSASSKNSWENCLWTLVELVYCLISSSEQQKLYSSGNWNFFAEFADTTQILNWLTSKERFWATLLKAIRCQIWTRDSWMGSASATSVLCDPPPPHKLLRAKWEAGQKS